MELSVKTTKRLDSVDVSKLVQEFVSKSNLKEGAVLVFCPHTTCSVIVNESFDHYVLSDMHSLLSKLVPQNSSFGHSEGNSDAHIKSVLCGSVVIWTVSIG